MPVNTKKQSQQQLQKDNGRDTDRQTGNSRRGNNMDSSKRESGPMNGNRNNSNTQRDQNR